MFRLMTASALAMTLATGAMAITAGEQAAIERFAPQADLSNLTDETVATLMNIVHGGGSFAEREAKVESILSTENAPRKAMFTDAERSALLDYVPQEVLPTVSKAEKIAVMAIMNSGETRTEKQAKIESLLTSSKPATSGMNDATSGEIVLINRVAPDVDPMALTQTELETVLNIINSSDDTNVEQRINAYLSS